LARKLEFSLEVLLKLRRQQESLARQTFARTLGWHRAIQARVARFRATLNEHHRKAREAILAGHGGGLYRTIAAGLSRAVAAESLVLQKARRQLDLRREQLMKAMRERKALSHLKGRLVLRQAAHAQQQAVKEQDDAHAAFAASRHLEANDAPVLTAQEARP